MSGAVDFAECTTKRVFTRVWRGRQQVVNQACRCAMCAICGWGKHMAAHGPCLGGLPGSKPWGHEFVGER